jgi:hypothetical protein
MKHVQVLVPVLSLLASTGAAIAAEEKEQRHVYRLEFVIAENDGGKVTTLTTNALNLEERQTSEIKVGSNVAVPGPTAGGTVRMDTGLKLAASFISIGEDILVDEDVEISVAKDAHTFRKMTARGKALVAPGKPALVASVEDATTHRHYQVTVSATKLR